jgi:site-specific recombinase XerD
METLEYPDAFYYDALDKAEISEKTRATYSYSLKRIQKLIPDKTMSAILNAPEESYATLAQTIQNKPSLQTTMASVLAAFKHSNIKKDIPDLLRRWYSFFGPLAAEVEKERESNIPTERQEKARVSWETVEEKLTTATKKERASREFLVLCMYTMIPPRRQEDYYQVYIYQDPNDASSKETHHAYIDLTAASPIIHVKDFKTASTMKAWTKDIPQRLLDEINMSLRNDPRDYLLTQKNGDAYTTPNSFTQSTNRCLSKILGSHVTVNSLRHAYATMIKEKGLSVWEYKQEARDMGNRMIMNMTYAFKS